MKKLLVALLLGTTLTVTACADATDTTTTAGDVTTTTAAATTTAGEATTTAGEATTTGTTTGEAQTKEITTSGMSEGLVVKVTATPDTIQAVEIVSHEETEGISDPAIENLPKKIVEENSFEVDGETGATMTSDAIKEAVKQALTEMGYDLENFK